MMFRAVLPALSLLALLPAHSPLQAVSAATPAAAIDPAYLGFWAPSPKACRADERTAFRITPKGISSYEEQCEIKQASPDGAGWLVRLSCASEGYDSTVTLRWQLAPNGRLRETMKGRTSEYIRCKESGQQVATYAEDRCTPIQFLRGARSATVTGMAPSDTPFACYTFVAGRGQTATIKLTQANQDTAFNVGGIVDSRTEYSFPTEAKAYRVDVYQIPRDRLEAPFAMEVSVK